MRNGASDFVNAAIVETRIHLSSASVFRLHYVPKTSSTEEQPIAADVHSAAPAGNEHLRASVAETKTDLAFSEL